LDSSLSPFRGKSWVKTSSALAVLPPRRRSTFVARSFVSSSGKCGTLEVVSVSPALLLRCVREDRVQVHGADAYQALCARRLLAFVLHRGYRYSNSTNVEDAKSNATDVSVELSVYYDVIVTS
jgi:hypothetical protein